MVFSGINIFAAHIKHTQKSLILLSHISTLSLNRDIQMINDSDATFIEDKYLHANKEALKIISEKIKKEERNSLFRNTVGGLIKGGYAILWEVSIFLRFTGR